VTKLDEASLIAFVSEVMPNGERLCDCSREEVQDVVSSLLSFARMLAEEKCQ
jgi:hypothetical protein